MAKSKVRSRGRLSLLLGSILATVLFVGVAYADDISNNLDTSADAVAETMPLTVGGADGTTRLYVIPQNGDGKNGCNLTGSTTASVSLASSNPGVATVSPNSVTFTSCVTSTTGPVVTVHPVAAGNTTISATLTGNTTGGSFNVSFISFTVNVTNPTPPNTPPHVSVTGVTGGASYNKGSVPAAGCSVTDAEDGPSSFAATLGPIVGPYTSDGIGEREASCSYTDAGGLTASASVTFGIVDPSAPVIDYTLAPASPTGNNGWYTGNVSLTWDVSEPQSPNSLNKTGCVNQNIVADQDETSYSCSATSAGGSAGPVNVSIKRDATNPTIAASRSPANGFGWNNSAVTVDYTCDDATSGVASCGPDDTLSSEGENQSSTGTAVDNAGNTANATVSNINIDLTDPSITATATPDPNGNGWNNSDVTVSFACSDSLSGIDTCPAAVTVNSEGTTTITRSAVDRAGNSKSASVTVKLDKTAPTISGSASPVANSHGWNNSSVIVNFTCADSLSGVDGTCGPGVTLSSEGANQSATGNVQDKAGNSASATVNNINIDLTDPSVSLVGGPADGASYYFGSVPAAPTCNASDALSGLDGACSVSDYSNAVGTHTVLASATDKAGNVNSASATYTVNPWTLRGFYAPVDMGTSVVNTVKGGSTVPLKFEIFTGSSELTDTASVQSLTSRLVSCTAFSGDATDDIELTATGGTALRYDTTAGQYIYNWKTPTGAAKCYIVTMTTDDGSKLSAQFKTK